jgi:hypothetical protein
MSACPTCGFDPEMMVDELMLRQASVDLRSERVDAQLRDLLAELAETRQIILALKGSR